MLPRGQVIDKREIRTIDLLWPQLMGRLGPQQTCADPLNHQRPRGQVHFGSGREITPLEGRMDFGHGNLVPIHLSKELGSGLPQGQFGMGRRVVGVFLQQWLALVERPKRAVRRPGHVLVAGSLVACMSVQVKKRCGDCLPSDRRTVDSSSGYPSASPPKIPLLHVWPGRWTLDPQNDKPPLQLCCPCLYCSKAKGEKEEELTPCWSHQQLQPSWKQRGEPQATSGPFRQTTPPERVRQSKRAQAEECQTEVETLFHCRLGGGE
jgi:hypothetical protein